MCGKLRSCTSTNKSWLVRLLSQIFWPTCRKHFNKIIRMFDDVRESVQWVLDYPDPDYLYPDMLTSAHAAMFSAPAGKGCCSRWSFVTEESKAAVRMTLPNATMLFPCSTGLGSRFTSELAERSHECCSVCDVCFVVLVHVSATPLFL